MLDATFIRPYAHRGLHNVARGIVENSQTAFEQAIALGVGIECDLQPASDATAMVHHDTTLDRVMEAVGPISAHPPEALARLAYRGSGDRMMTLAGLLELTAGRVPLLIEVKNDFVPPDHRFLTGIAATLARYQGPAALMSFDPEVMVALRALAPGVPRGLVAGRYRETGWWSDRLSPARRAALSAMADADRAGIAFANYHAADLPTPETTAMRLRGTGQVFAWTVRTADDRARALAHADAAVFEGEVPATPGLPR